MLDSGANVYWETFWCYWAQVNGSWYKKFRTGPPGLPVSSDSQRWFQVTYKPIVEKTAVILPLPNEILVEIVADKLEGKIKAVSPFDAIVTPFVREPTRVVHIS